MKARAGQNRRPVVTWLTCSCLMAVDGEREEKAAELGEFESAFHCARLPSMRPCVMPMHVVALATYTA
jgi:hypothetical protein